MYKPKYLEKVKEERSLKKFEQALREISNRSIQAIEEDYSDYGFYWDGDLRRIIVNGQEERDVVGVEVKLKVGDVATVKIEKLIKKGKVAIKNERIEVSRNHLAEND